MRLAGADAVPIRETGDGLTGSDVRFPPASVRAHARSLRGWTVRAHARRADATEVLLGVAITSGRRATSRAVAVAYHDAVDGRRYEDRFRLAIAICAPATRGRATPAPP
jgi:hypothetical protein